LLLTAQLLDSAGALRLATQLQIAGKAERAELLRVAADLGGQLDVDQFLTEAGWPESDRLQDLFDW
jgi:hypothetical protein